MLEPGALRHFHRNSDTQDQKSKSPSAQVDEQIGILREIAMEIVDQVESFRAQSTSLEAGHPLSFNEEMRRFEIQLIRNALVQTKGHQLKAAKLLGLKATTLNAKIKRYNLSPILFGRLNLRKAVGS